MNRASGVLAACFLALPSCLISRSSANEPLDPSIVRSLTPGTTTAKECVERLGAPSEVVWLGARSAYRYDHRIGKQSGLLLLIFGLYNSDEREDRVWLFFDEKNVLSHVGATYASHRPQHAMPWEDIHEQSDSDAADADRPAVRGEGR